VANPLLQIGQKRFRSFSDAAELLVGALTDVVPGTVALTRLESDEQSYRVIEAGGEGVAGLALRAVLPPAGDGIDTDFLRTLGARDWICAPLELSNGKIVGVIVAAGSEPASYGPENEAQLGIAARILSYEWESVELRSELRRLRGRVNAGPDFDADTGLPSRESFLDLMGREWRLAERGTVQSVLLACRVYGDGGDDGGGASDLRQALALKVAAEVLEGTIRETDRIGRVAESTLGVVLIGCRPEDTPSFVARFLSALERVAGEGEDRVQVACGVQPLDGTSSPHEALGLAEAAASEAEPEQPVAEGTAVE
jgi:GGDEF domain-containing protein